MIAVYYHFCFWLILPILYFGMYVLGFGVYINYSPWLWEHYMKLVLMSFMSSRMLRRHSA